MNRLDQRMEEIRLWEEWKMGDERIPAGVETGRAVGIGPDYQRAQPKGEAMTITIELLNQVGDKTVHVDADYIGSKTVSEGSVAPGDKKTFNLWNGKHLVIREADELIGVIAEITVHNFTALTPEQRLNVAAWLEKQGEVIRFPGDSATATYKDYYAE